jgi:hypothetical protein
VPASAVRERELANIRNSREETDARMKFFIDTADLAEIRGLAATGLLDGVTTNPSLVAKTGRGLPCPKGPSRSS